ncbi:uncharacterized protein LOC130944356 [Arachis stenosperma]|uniref:uncharacterized protein LOC130944356 n=1 Tax=Arachis stenosperma TaxID=217475 RepID=UPI0025ABB617|nr:uncharacterized protein LOC130944356 [Arachis stenosperma]
MGGLKVVTPCLQWSLPHYSPSSSPSSCSQTLASAISSPSYVYSYASSKRRSFNPSLSCRFVHPCTLFKTTSFLHKSRSLDFHNHLFSTNTRTPIRRSCSASLDSFSDEEFAKKIEDLTLGFQLNEDDSDSDTTSSPTSSSNFVNGQSIPEPPWMVSGGGEEIIIPANIERKANSVELPFSLRIIKKKLQWKEGFREAGESACCSVKKAFSSMVFIIRELHSYTLQMRETLCYQDLQGILERVQTEMHASFVWLFQQVFSHTPTLMVYVMILLANFTVHSMGHNAAVMAAVNPPTLTMEMEEEESVSDNQSGFDSSAVKTFTVSSSNGKKTTSVGGGNGGGGKFRPAAHGTDGEGRSDRSDRHQGTVFPDGLSSTQSQVYRTGESNNNNNNNAESSSVEEEEEELWSSMVEEASRMEDVNRGSMKQFISPVTAKMESDDYAEYLRTELVYQTGLSKEPNNSLLLSNYAQFLYLVAHDYDRAEEYFKKAIGVEPRDPEAFNKYATFLWKAKNDLWAAEETYLEAISAEPTNSFYAADYAHFLWNTGGEDTCYPLSSDASQEL